MSFLDLNEVTITIDENSLPPSQGSIITCIFPSEAKNRIAALPVSVQNERNLLLCSPVGKFSNV